MKLDIGIDWSQSKHDVCFLNSSGAVQAQAGCEVEMVIAAGAGEL